MVPVSIHDNGYTIINLSNPGYIGIIKYTQPTRNKHVPIMVKIVGAILRPIARKADAVISYEQPSACKPSTICIR